MAFNPTKTRTWKDGTTPATGTPALGSLFDAEYDQLYENDNYFKDNPEINKINTDEIVEKTVDAGVTIEGVNVKDGKIVNIETDDPLIVNDTTESTTKDTGSIITEGGIGAEKNIVNGGYLQSGKGRKISGSYVNGSGHINELYDYFVSNSIMPNTEDTLIIAGSVYWSSSLCVVSSARRVNSNTIWLYIMDSAGTTDTLSLTTGNTNACGFNLAW